MKEKIKNIIQKLTPWSMDEDFDSSLTGKEKNATFQLLFDDKTVGTLNFTDGTWVFKYSDNLKEEKFISPLIDFPDLNKVYEFNHLVPFFAARIPNLNQPFHEEKLENNQGDRNSLVSLLKIFGARSVNNPFELKYV